MGCKSVQCAPALSCEKQPVDQAAYPRIWTSGKYDSFQMVVTAGPYRVKDSSIRHLKKVVKEQAGLDIEVLDGADTGLPARGKVTEKEALAAGLRQIPSSDKPVLVVVVMPGLKGVEYEYKGVLFKGQSALRKRAKEYGILLPENLSSESDYFGVIVLNHGSIVERCFEDLILTHEVGHWLGVPARDFHTTCDHIHCTNGRCLMFAGKLDFLTAIRLLAVDVLGPPRQYGPSCAEELAEMTRQRQANREKLKTQTK